MWTQRRAEIIIYHYYSREQWHWNTGEFQWCSYTARLLSNCIRFHKGETEMETQMLQWKCDRPISCIEKERKCLKRHLFSFVGTKRRVPIGYALPPHVSSINKRNTINLNSQLCAHYAGVGVRKRHSRDLWQRIVHDTTRIPPNVTWPITNSKDTGHAVSASEFRTFSASMPSWQPTKRNKNNSTTGDTRANK